MDRPLYVYEYADVAFDDAIALLAQDAASLLQDATDVAHAHTGDVESRLHVPFGGFDVGREVSIEVGDFEPIEQLRSRIPVRWTSAHAAALFPALDGHLEITAMSLDPPQVQVTLVGTYTPPLGLVGVAAEGLGGRRLVDATVKRFVQDVVARLESQV